jgi:predicted PurR-regulated permease PerM
MTTNATANTEASPSPVHVETRNVSLVVLASLASIYTLHWASAVFIPVMVGMLFSYALSPIVDWLQVRFIPRAVSAALLVLGIVTGIVFGAYSLSEEASKLVELLPQAAQKLNAIVHSSRSGSDNTFTAVQKAATRLEQAAADSTQPTSLSHEV